LRKTIDSLGGLAWLDQVIARWGFSFILSQ
jgi:hypothetical protein